MYLSQVSPEDMPESVRDVWAQAGEGGKRFIAAMAHAPEHAERLFPYYNGVRYGTALGPSCASCSGWRSPRPPSARSAWPPGGRRRSTPG